MKKLILLIIIVPMIGSGQITVNESKKKDVPIWFKNISYSVQSGIGLELHPDGNLYFHENLLTFFSYYIVPDLDYKIPLSSSINLYNNISLPIILRKKKVFDAPGYWQENSTIEYRSRILIRMEYNTGIEHKINQNLQFRGGITLPIVSIARDIGKEKIFENDGPGGPVSLQPPKEWGAGINIKLDYLTEGDIGAFFSVSHERTYSVSSLLNSNSPWYTEIVIGVNYDL